MKELNERVSTPLPKWTGGLEKNDELNNALNALVLHEETRRTVTHYIQSLINRDYIIRETLSEIKAEVEGGDVLWLTSIPEKDLRKMINKSFEMSVDSEAYIKLKDVLDIIERRKI